MRRCEDAKERIVSWRKKRRKRSTEGGFILDGVGTKKHTAASINYRLSVDSGVSGTNTLFGAKAVGQLAANEKPKHSGGPGFLCVANHRRYARHGRGLRLRRCLRLDVPERRAPVFIRRAKW